MSNSMRAVTLGVIAAGVVAGSLALGVVPAVAAAPPGTFEVDYDVSGTSTIAKPNSTIKLGPTVGKTYISNAGDGSFTADLPLPPTTSTFKIAGLIPVSAKVNFIPAGTLRGTISQDSPTRLTATAYYTIRLTDVKAAGLPTFQGATCQTKAPVAIPVATPAGQSFDVTTGGTVAGTYTIGEFANCGLTTGLINLLVPGPNNTVSLQLTNGRFVG